MSNWTLFSNHGHVLICLARDPETRLRDVAADVGITERAVQKIVRDLQDGGMVSVTKSGRRNCYRIHSKTLLRHDLEAHCTVSDVVNIINKASGSRQDMAETQPTVVSKTRSIDPKPGKLEPKKVQPKAPEVAKSGSGKTSVSDTIERQQGSLF
jgi:hypothetical protein